MKVDGLKLKMFREKKGYSLNDLSIKCGIAISTLNKWETSPIANPFPSKLKVVSEALCISMNDIVVTEQNEAIGCHHQLTDIDYLALIKKIICLIEKNDDEAMSKLNQIINILNEGDNHVC